MLYFVLWVIFLLIVLLAVPVVAQVEKRRYRAAHPKVAGNAEVAEQWSDDEDPDADFGGEADVIEESEEAVEFGEVDGDDEFADFDEIK